MIGSVRMLLSLFCLLLFRDLGGAEAEGSLFLYMARFCVVHEAIYAFFCYSL